MRDALAVVLVAGLVAASPAAAQHQAAIAVALGEDDRCGVCHLPHGGAPGPYALKVDPAVPAWDQLGAPGLGTVSQSCLRCHVTDAVRTRQPEFAGRAVISAGSGTYLGPDPTNGHPLGQLSERVRREREWAWPDPRRSRLPPTRLNRTSPAQENFLECTSCHDPHRRDTALPRPEEQSLICGRCHELSRYSVERHASLACGDCHALHGGTGMALIAERTTEELCRSCHDPGAAVLRRQVVQPAPIVRPGHLRSPGGSCEDCHGTHRK